MKHDRGSESRAEVCGALGQKSEVPVKREMQRIVKQSIKPFGDIVSLFKLQPAHYDLNTDMVLLAYHNTYALIVGKYDRALLVSGSKFRTYHMTFDHCHYLGLRHVFHIYIFKRFGERSIALGYRFFDAGIKLPALIRAHPRRKRHTRKIARKSYPRAYYYNVFRR